MNELIPYLERIANALEQIAFAQAPKSPSYRRPLAEYPDFDWSTIGAEVVARDRNGATAVAWGGYEWRRRAKVEFGEDIWFTRPDGKSEDGRNNYLRLITFSPPKAVKRLPSEVRDAVEEATGYVNGHANGHTPAPAQPARTHTPPPPPEPPAPEAPEEEETDWEFEAATADDELMFDSAIARCIAWFNGDSNTVRKFRETIWNEFNPDHAPAYVRGLQKYAETRKKANGSRTAHNRAKTLAMETYRKEVEKAEGTAVFEETV